MKPFAYYNEIEPYAAEWLRNLIAAGHIAPGVVDTRSIEDVSPSDLAEFTQCHFFAGIGVWSHALRRAGWADSDPVWTGSCPCQPFSAAGKGSGFADERHLWPHFHYLIEECRPAVVLGEQVASADGLQWLDLVSTDLEATGYAVGAADLCAAGVGAPHIRQRLYWVAHAERHTGGRQAEPADHIGAQADRPADRPGRRSGASGGLANLHGNGRESGLQGRPPVGHGATAESGGGAGGVADNASERLHGRGSSEARDGQDEARQQPQRLCDVGNPGPVNGLWRDADWLFCRDGKWRPVEPGTFPLAHGAPARVGRLRAYGNAINAVQGEVFIRAVMECMP